VKVNALETDGIREARAELVVHPLYARLESFEDARLFARYHVFAVWDFFSLLKRLQREVSCVAVPWLPRGMSDHARFIHEILIAEESDTAPTGGYTSHFELYLDAMDEIGADRTTIDSFCLGLQSGLDPSAALVEADAPAFVANFVETTLEVAIDGEAHEVAASFCHARENLLADVLMGVRGGLGAELDQAPIFKYYLDRHIALDHEEHGPLAMQLLRELCSGDPLKLREAERVGIEAIRARAQLWDGILAELDAPVGS
jgi:hypothetical protein